MDVGTQVLLKLWLGDKSVGATAVVATQHPQVGNGYDFVDMPPNERLALSMYLAAAEGAETKTT